MYFGLQTGWVTMGSLQSSLLGFAIFKVLLRDQTFGPIENVLLQTAAVATATMPLAGGFVGIIPALKMMKEEDGGSIVLSTWQLIVFSGGLAFFGVFFAVPLRTQTILREKLKFPSGYATAEMIKVLHGVKRDDEYDSDDSDAPDSGRIRHIDIDDTWRHTEDTSLTGTSPDIKAQLIVLAFTFLLSGCYVVFSYFVPVLKNIPVFTYMGLPLATEFYWMITPSFSYIGQGMIMGVHTCLSMLVGAVLGWGILGPTARQMGWAPGPVNSFDIGAQGWILWISLAVMMAESVSSLVVLVFKWGYHRILIWRSKKDMFLDEEVDPATPEQQVPTWWWAVGLLFASALAVVCTWGVFRQYGDRIPFYQPIVGVALALIVSVLAVRALGETDVNPVSGVGKLSQVAFALVAPNNIASNLVAGAIAEAGAQQAGDMMQDLKTGHLLRASPKAQFIGQFIGSFFSVFVAVGAFELYSNSYEIPGPEFQVPTAPVWLNMARFVNGGKLPPYVVWFCIGFGIIAVLLPILQAIFPKQRHYIISGMAVGIAMYVTPNWTLPRFVGAMMQWIWKTKWRRSHDKFMLVTASGFVLGEGVLSIVTALLKNPGGVTPWTCAGCAPGFCSCPA